MQKVTTAGKRQVVVNAANMQQVAASFNNTHVTYIANTFFYVAENVVYIAQNEIVHNFLQNAAISNVQF